jgi:hypothetical protein
MQGRLKLSAVPISLGIAVAAVIAFASPASAMTARESSFETATTYRAAPPTITEPVAGPLRIKSSTDRSLYTIGALPVGTTLTATAGREYVLRDATGAAVGVLQRPVAVDANNDAVPAALEVNDGVLIMLE